MNSYRFDSCLPPSVSPCNLDTKIDRSCVAINAQQCSNVEGGNRKKVKEKREERKVAMLQCRKIAVDRHVCLHEGPLAKVLHAQLDDEQ